MAFHIWEISGTGTGWLDWLDVGWVGCGDLRLTFVVGRISVVLVENMMNRDHLVILFSYNWKWLIEIWQIGNVFLEACRFACRFDECFTWWSRVRESSQRPACCFYFKVSYNFGKVTWLAGKNIIMNDDWYFTRDFLQNGLILELSMSEGTLEGKMFWNPPLRNP